MDYIYLALKITVENENFVTVAYDIFRYKATKLSDSEAMKMHISPPRDACTPNTKRARVPLPANFVSESRHCSTRLDILLLPQGRRS
jgi:hypothetical protein